jgi:peptidoglycan/LPS O-acetylase OafA/YrhL
VAISSNPPSATAAPIPSLDGIRGVAVSLVFFAHSGLEQFVPGGLGVTIFFVLSGYLITTLMVTEHRAAGSINLRAFYMRRLLRLMPPLLLVVAAAWLLSSLSLIEGAFTSGGLLSVLFYFANYYFIAASFHGVPAGLGVMWSLAVEEHFYLLYPPLAIALLNAARPRLSAAVLALLCALVLARRCWLASHGAAEAYLDMATDSRADAILVGCFMGLLRNPWPRCHRSRSPRWNWALGLACVGALLLSLIVRDASFRGTLRYTLQSLAIAPLIYLAIAHAGHAVFRWLNSRPMIYLGSISYSVYLSHQLILDLVARHWPQLGWADKVLLSAALTLVTAAALRHWIEKPCAALRKRMHRRPGPCAAAAAGLQVNTP